MISAYEEKRKQSIAENQSELIKLGIQRVVPQPERKPKPERRGKEGGPATHGLKRIKLDAASLWAPSFTPSPTECCDMAHADDGTCAVCSGTDDADDNKILLCDGSRCGAAYHQRCLTPPLERIPRKEWLCPTCQGSTVKTGLSQPSPQSVVDTCAVGCHATPLPDAPVRENVRHATSKSSASAKAALSSAHREGISKPNSPQEWQRERRRLLLLARASLHLASVPTSVLCREQQCESIIGFCRARLSSSRGGAMYVCGSPGLGKSLTVRQAHDAVQRLLSPKDRMCFINAFRLDSPATVYTSVLQAICGYSDGGVRAHMRKLDSVDAKAALERLVLRKDEANSVAPKVSAKKAALQLGSSTSGGKSCGADGMCVILLDEIDQLLSLHQQVLYTLFEWAAVPTSRLILIGIANALDLTERFLPRLRAHDATPEALHFPPYSDVELGAIVKQRLSPSALAVADSPTGSAALGGQVAAALATSCASACATSAIDGGNASTALIDPNAVIFCSKKVANASGDARRVLEVSRLAVDRALDELSAPLESLPPWATKPLIRFEHMSSALSLAFKSPMISLLASLPQHQQVLLCSMVLRSRRIAAKAAMAAAAADAQAAEMGASKPSSVGPRDASNFLLQARPRASAKAGATKAGHAVMKAAGGVVSSAGKKMSSTATVNNRCTLADLHREYSRVCTAQQLRALSSDEIYPLCNNLAACGVFGLSGATGAGPTTGNKRGHVGNEELQRTVWLCVSEDDVKMATKELRFFRQLLDK
ncbi:hypothetical protein AB1Y20_008720 [Prymnesium parvum]|uniref:PHD-type domain-containing protein n=1 Tax=Prymnesium parvum TaxID=97485 RepID=A0AB34IUN5_PRYPA